MKITDLTKEENRHEGGVAGGDRTDYDDLADELKVKEGKRVLIADLPLSIRIDPDEKIEQELRRRGVKVKIVEVQEARTPSWIKVEVMS